MSPSFASSNRFTIYVVAVFVLFSIVSGRLFYLHVINREHARTVISENRYRFQEISPRRGVILDCKGNVLASSRSAWDIGVDPMMVDIRDKEKLSYLSMILNVSVEKLEADFGWKDQAAGKVSRKRWVKLASEVDESVYKAVEKLDVSGVYGNRYYMRYYPSGHDAAHVVGFMNKEHVPVMGVERSLDFYLRGSAGWTVREMNGSRREIRQYRVRDVAAQNGYNIQLTLDSGIQRVVEGELERIYKDLDPESVTIIVSESRTGSILALGCRPTFDPNEFWNYDLDEDLRNRAISDIYEPGSTFKIITAAGFINDGLGDRSTRFDCSTRSVIFRNRKVVLPTDTHQHGVMELHEIIKKSSNRGTALAGLEMGEERMFDYCKAFGFGSKTGIELNGEESGILHSVANWDHYTLSRLSIGYGVGVTPLQMHVAMSVIANDGEWIAPHIADCAMDGDMRPVILFQKPEPVQVISSATAHEIRDCLIEVVNAGGTGTRAQNRKIEIAGKTGTSRKLFDDGYSDKRHVGSFSGFFPARNPEYVITVVVNDPRKSNSTYGGSVAAPAFKAIADFIISSRGIESVPADHGLIAWNY